ncbi:HeH/LEM domain-containing protein [Pseudomonas frederiksbergensis]|uniref:HeH/LEM domain-containing protein n=1 Tax=Pseudomonas frederiksbergensis TaxID=104087 RepID=A0A1H4ZM21_9PSED|nr:HeH/LEM domain-containing protein [Pseudomonas frederiksbergensis]SED30440.1 HeH/LEM domain-containing protein [Pseudomonas frederiksbergensis]
MKVIYTDKPGNEPEVCYRLLNEFFGVISSAKEVVVDGDKPNIIEAYKRAGIIVTDGKTPSLREDGPTVAEFMDAGYQAANYPPQGYVSRSTPEEIAEAIKGQANPETDPLKMKVADLKEWLTGKGIAFDASALKEDLQALVPKE